MIKQLLAAITFIFLPISLAVADPVQESTDNYGPFEALHIYQTSPQPRHVVIFISGDAGWDLGMVSMAKSLTELDDMVVGIDSTHYIGKLDKGTEKCNYAAAHFEALSQYIQKKYNFKQYIPPVLVGYSSGATIVYVTLAQSPPNTFAGGIAMGFCTELKTSKPFCKGNGRLSYSPDPKLGYIYNAVPHLAAKLYVLQGDTDQVCSTPSTREFLSKVSDAELTELSKVGHGFSVEKNWMPQFKQVFHTIVDHQQPNKSIALTSALPDLPLLEFPAKGSDILAVVISGDGGWASIDKQISETLNDKGIAVIGLNSLQYFWKKKNPDIAANDLSRILQLYSNIWSTKKIMLIGYSTGADTLPFMVNRLPLELKSKIQSISLLGLASNANFEFHVSDWLTSSDGLYKVIPEVQKLKSMNVLCIYGEDESDSACRSLRKNDFHIIETKGGHHFSGDYEMLAKTILEHSR
jgi:type IV secretory pathway VirJ component